VKGFEVIVNKEAAINQPFCILNSILVLDDIHK